MKRTSLFKKQSIARNSIYTVSSDILINIVAIFVAGYIAKSLGVLDYGRFVFAFAFVDTFTLFSNMGIHTVQVREIAKNPQNAPAFFGSTFIFRILSAVFTFGLVALVISFLDYPVITKTVVYIAGIALIFNYAADSCKAAFKAHEKMQFMAFLNIIDSCISMALRVLVIYLGFGLLTLSWTVAFISFISALLPYLVLRHYFFKPVFSLTYKKLKDIFILTLPFYVSMVFWVIYKRIDVILLSFIRGEEHVGWYSASFLLVSRLSFFSSAIVGAIFPVISRLSAINKSDAEKIYRGGLLVLFLFGLPIAIGFFLGAEKIIMLIYDSQFSQSIAVLQILAWTVPLVFLSQLMASTLNAFGKEKIVAKITAAYVVANIVVNFILIPQFGFLGAAMSLLISELVNILANFIYITFKLNISSFDLKYFKISSAGVLMGAILHFGVPHFHIILYILIGAVTYFTGLYLLRALPMDTVHQVKEMVLNNRRV